MCSSSMGHGGQPLGAIHPIGLRRSGYQLPSEVHKYVPEVRCLWDSGDVSLDQAIWVGG